MATAQANEVPTEADDRTRPPFLRRVRIRGYKSIASCDVALQPLTILVGRNASGKSNFLDALAFLRDALVNGTTKAVELHGGRRAILHRKVRGSTFSISFEAEFKAFPGRIDPNAIYFVDYNVEFKLPAKSKPVISRERVRIKTVPNGPTIGFDRKNSDIKWMGIRANLIPKGRWFSSDNMIIGRLEINSIFQLADIFNYFGFYNFHPDAIRNLQKPTIGLMVERTGRNLASTIRVFSAGGVISSRIEAYLNAIVPEIEKIKVVRYGEYETIRFQLHSNTGGKPLEFDAASMSDGTLRALAVLVVAFQFHPLPCPNVVGIEEPETALHPAAIRALMDALNEATGRTQILLTTQSAELLADRDLHPSQVLVVRNRDGQTQITPVDSASREIIEKELFTLADLQRQDHLDLDEADLQRQAAERAGNGGA